MFLITFVSALACFSSYVLSAFFSSFASLSFLRSLRHTRGCPCQLAASCLAAASNAAAAVVYASRS